MDKIKVLLVVIILALLAIGAVLFLGNQSLKKEVARLQVLQEEKSQNERVVEFMNMFVNDVLIVNSGEVSVEKRLKLETAVRDLHDTEILTQWQKFTASQNEGDAQNQVKQLLRILVSKARKS